jgi:hypothetical protein
LSKPSCVSSKCLFLFAVGLVRRKPCAADGAGMAAKLGDHLTVRRNLHIIDAGAAAARYLARGGNQLIAEPWAMRWPFTMCGCTFMVSVARPGPTSTIFMPSPLEASSPFHIASAQARARSSGDSVAFTFTSNSRQSTTIFSETGLAWQVRMKPAFSSHGSSE